MMRHTKTLISLLLIALNFQSCGVYSLSGVSIDPGTENFQVRFFQNEAGIVEPGIDRTFTFALQDLIQNQTSLTLTDGNADLVYEGEIVEYYIAPQASTSANTAAQNRLTIAVNVRFYNNKKPDGSDDFEKRFSFFDDVPAETQLVGTALTSSLDVIFERITQDIFNESLAKW